MGKYGNFGVGIDVPDRVLEDQMSGRTVGSDLFHLIGGGLTTLSHENRQRSVQDRDYALRVKSEEDSTRLRQEQINALREDRAARREERASQNEYVMWDADKGRVIGEGEDAPDAAPQIDTTTLTPEEKRALDDWNNAADRSQMDAPKGSPEYAATESYLDEKVGAPAKAAPKADLAAAVSPPKGRTLRVRRRDLPGLLSTYQRGEDNESSRKLREASLEETRLRNRDLEANRQRDDERAVDAAKEKKTAADAKVESEESARLYYAGAGKELAALMPPGSPAFTDTVNGKPVPAKVLKDQIAYMHKTIATQQAQTFQKEMQEDRQQGQIDLADYNAGKMDARGLVTRANTRLSNAENRLQTAQRTLGAAMRSQAEAVSKGLDATSFGESIQLAQFMVNEAQNARSQALSGLVGISPKDAEGLPPPRPPPYTGGPPLVEGGGAAPAAPPAASATAKPAAKDEDYVAAKPTDVFDTPAQAAAALKAAAKNLDPQDPRAVELRKAYGARVLPSSFPSEMDRDAWFEVAAEGLNKERQAALAAKVYKVPVVGGK